MPKPRDPNSPWNARVLRAMMEGSLGGQPLNKRDRQERAQRIVYEAMEAATSARRLRLVREALEMDPENVDALLMAQEASDSNPEERIESLRSIVAAGAKRLGKKAFKELVPHFWGFIETRPYMRARRTLAEALRMAGRLEEAAQEYAEMLALNVNDNQGVRYEMLAVLLTLGWLEEARALMDRYKSDCEWCVVFAWGRVLERVLAGNEKAAAKALMAARKQNPHMEVYLAGRKLPKKLPGGYSPGSKEEALCYGEVLTSAWKAHPQALEWLQGR